MAQDVIRIALSITPIEQLTDENDGVHENVAGEIGKSLGGSAEALVSAYDTAAADQGYLNATVNYLEAIDSADTTNISGEGAATMVFIKNTGYRFSTATVLGAALAKSLKIMVGTALVTVLDPGEAWYAKDDNGGIDCEDFHVRTVDTDGSNNDDAGHLAVERLVTNNT